MATQTTLNEFGSVDVVCPTCGRTDFKNRRGVENHHAIAHGESIGGVSVTCDTCGEETRKPPSEVERAESHYCSDECRIEGVSATLRTREKYPCDYCGKPKELTPWRREWLDNHYCSRRCFNEDRKHRVMVECGWCAEEFEVPPSEKDMTTYCSKECYTQWLRTRRGSDHPLWMGADFSNFFRNSLPGCWSEIKQEVREERENCCRHCGITGDEINSSLHVHHIIPISFGGTHHKENLMLLCPSCHPGVDSYMRRNFSLPCIFDPGDLF